MINLKEVADKIESILNDTLNDIRIENERVIFVCATEGYKLDSNFIRKEGKNYIPVFVGLNSGENNPTPNFSQQSKRVEISLYFPLKYKNEFYTLENYLLSQLRAKKVNFGAISGDCLTTMGIITYGEIVAANFNQFKDWVSSKYENIINVTGNYMSMSFILSITQVGEGFIFGNDIKYRLYANFFEFEISSVLADNVLYERYAEGDISASENQGVPKYCWKHRSKFGYTLVNPNDTLDHKLQYLTKGYSVRIEIETTEGETESVTISGADLKVFEESSSHPIWTRDTNVIWSSAGSGANISPIAQHCIDKPYATNVPNIINYNQSFLANVDLGFKFWKIFVALYSLHRLDVIKNFKIVKTIDDMIISLNQTCLSINENTLLGEVVSYTFTFGDAE